MKWLMAAVGIILAITGLLFFDYFRPAPLLTNFPNTAMPSARDMATRIRQAEEKAQRVKGIYMTSHVANDPGRAAAALRNDILTLLDTTELNGVVIDVKETEGGLVITDQLRKLIATLHEKEVWVVGRQVVFKDSSQERMHPDWYLKSKSGNIWRDNRNGSWLDPASREVWDYQLVAAKAASDVGFDELQFDYIRFPSDGDVRNIVYPIYDGRKPKREVLRAFFAFLHDELKRHRPDLILSADLFGYVALQKVDLGIGQHLQDIGENFDYVSLMVYPSHYYAGFEVAADEQRNLGAVYYPYRSLDISRVAVNKPYDVVYRSLLIAQDILADGVATATDQIGQSGESARPPSGLGESHKTETISPVSRRSLQRARLRPWLQDFDLSVDSSRGIHYDAKKVRAQIDAAEAAGSSGWLLWSPDNIYTQEALKPE